MKKIIETGVPVFGMGEREYPKSEWSSYEAISDQSNMRWGKGMNINQIYNEDCLQGMKRIPDGSVDLIVTDPPYKLTSGGCRGSLDIVFNKADYTGVSKGAFFEIPKFSTWIQECYRVLKNGTHFYCMTNDKNLNDIYNAAASSGFKEVNILVWKKYMHVPTAYYMKNVEYILLFRKGSARKIANLGDFTLIEGIRGVYGNKVHVSEKPVRLFEKFIHNSSSKEDLVLDPFMGSGTTAIACINTNRKFIGFELDKGYYELGVNRMKNAFSELK